MSRGLLGGSWDLAGKVISTLIEVISIAALIITLVTKSHDPLSSCPEETSTLDLELPQEFDSLQ